MEIDWSRAPQWANYAAMDENGTWYWYSEEPKLFGCCWASEGRGFSEEIAIPKEIWQSSMTLRPEE